MKLRSEITLPEYKLNLTYQSKMLSLGSCFSDHIGQKLKTHWFAIEVNPFGVLFNPFSIANLIQRALSKDFFREEEIMQRGEIYFIYDFHSELSSTDEKELLIKANKQLEKLKIYLETSNLLMLTFGTSYYYELRDSKKIVANCHKMPQTFFKKQKGNSGEISALYSSLIKELKKRNPKLEVLFTVSPVRHSNDGFIENNRSKAELILAVEALEKLEYVSYFPSYEIQMDELRDYRFYAEDLNHPNELAFTYIFDKFKKALFSETLCKQILDVEKVLKQENHRLFFPETEESKKYLKDLAFKKSKLEQNLLGKTSRK